MVYVRRYTSAATLNIYDAQPPGAPARDWLAGIDCRVGLLSFISRHHLQGWQRGGALLKEIPQKDATMLGDWS